MSIWPQTKTIRDLMLSYLNSINKLRLDMSLLPMPISGCHQIETMLNQHSPELYLMVSCGFGVIQVLMNASASTGNTDLQFWALSGVTVLMVAPILHGTCKNKRGAPILFALSFITNFVNLWQGQPWMLASYDTTWMTVGIAVFTAVTSIVCDNDMRLMVSQFSLLKKKIEEDPTNLLRLWKLIVATVKTGLFTQLGRWDGAGTSVLGVTIGDSLLFSIFYYRANDRSSSIEIRLPQQKRECVYKIIPLLVLLIAIFLYEGYTLDIRSVPDRDQMLLSVALFALLVENIPMALYHKVISESEMSQSGSDCETSGEGYLPLSEGC
jgi:hypothetical protein